ncbi:hypothetical protein D3C87_1756200 [compost metagenome]
MYQLIRKHKIVTYIEHHQVKQGIPASACCITKGLHRDILVQKWKIKKVYDLYDKVLGSAQH